MTVEEMAKACTDALGRGLDKVLFVVPGPRNGPTGRAIRLDRTSRKKCPMGEVANWQDDPPRTVAYFDAIEVLAWLAARGLIKVVEAPRGQA